LNRRIVAYRLLATTPVKLPTLPPAGGGFRRAAG
jgi:hypothetical protein